MINSSFNKQTNILETKFDGEISIQELLNYIISVRENKDFPSKIKILSDATSAKFSEDVRKKELSKFLEENKITLSNKEFIHDAFIISGSFETALGMLYQALIKIENYQHNH